LLWDSGEVLGCFAPQCALFITLFIKLSMSEAFSNSAICQSASLPEDLPQFIYYTSTQEANIAVEKLLESIMPHEWTCTFFFCHTVREVQVREDFCDEEKSARMKND
jgi:hypothetical protein